MVELQIWLYMYMKLDGLHGNGKVGMVDDGA